MRPMVMLSCLVVLAGSAAADVVSLQAAQDNTLYENASGSLSNGVGPGLFAGQNSQNLRRRALVAFDLSAIPAGSVINSVTLNLFMEQGGAGPASYGVHRVLATWGEGDSNAGSPGGNGAPASPGDATWTSRFFGSGQNWASPGGDFAGASASTLLGASAAYAWSSGQMTSDVQAWLDGAATNAGWVLIGGEGVSSSARRFTSREGPIVENRPTLVVDYTVPAPGTLALAAVGLASVVRRRR